ncbi:hypothetical protein N0M98_01455 [Paenibacillus doosanensis]|uniref:Lipoprotein n=1 Tax=Paenibacillus konkukensis TaxID=2020716 RepID=A0ABY4RWJ5_9BACL|nr:MULTISPECIES: hypothetical protein [Paenibacillus]MCS7458792.1 hypothetical protein [Paenibacillus doosanensis]UQZ86682.1 hypothetical protein SK3146_05975 [Paenibacillus konkukensis]
MLLPFRFIYSVFISIMIFGLLLGCQNKSLPVPNPGSIIKITVMEYKSRKVITEHTDQNEIIKITDKINSAKKNGLSEPLPSPKNIIVFESHNKKIEFDYIHSLSKDILVEKGAQYQWEIAPINDLIF